MGERHPQMPPQMMLMRTTRASVDPLGTLSYATTGNVESNAPFTSIEVRMVPENVSSIAKTPPNPTRRRSRTARANSSRRDFRGRLARATAPTRTPSPAILQAFGLKHGESPVAEGQKIILQFADADR